MGFDYRELKDALALVGELCTTDQIKDVLRRRKGEDGVRLTAETKEGLVRRNLRDAVEAKAVGLDDVFDLIRSAEENGNQHIFYYRPRVRKIADMLSIEYVARQLWPSDWEKVLASFPAIRVQPNDYRYTDLRLASTKKPKDWILKIYGHSVLTRSTGNEERRPNNTVWREYIEEELRSVLMARWNHPDLLEIRVQRNEGRARIQAWQRKVWDMLSPALIPSQFTPWELSNAMARLLLKQEEYETTYTFRDARVVDGSGIHASFQTYAQHGGLFDSMQVRDALKSFMEAKSDCTGLAITWLPRDGTPATELRTLLAAKDLHEIVISGHCRNLDVDYVTDQLRFFSKTTS
jgi:hypothetical protein